MTLLIALLLLKRIGLFTTEWIVGAVVAWLVHVALIILRSDSITSRMNGIAQYSFRIGQESREDY
jgi:hypothetical protein